MRIRKGPMATLGITNMGTLTMTHLLKLFLLPLLIYSLGVLPLSAQTAGLLPQPKQQYLDENGNPLSGGKVYNYVPNTTTPKTTWSNSNASTPNSNPVILDSAGRGTIYGTGNYRQVVKTAGDVTKLDGVTASVGTSSTYVTDLAPLGTIIPLTGLTVPTNYVLANGQAISRTTYADYFTSVTIVQNGTCVASSSTISGLADTSNIRVGANFEASCLGATNLTVNSKTSSSVTLSGNAASTGTVSTRAFLYGNGDGSTTFNVIDLTGRALAGVDASGTNLTSAGLGQAALLGATGGASTKTLLTANLPPYTPTGTVAGTVTVANVPQGSSSASTGSDFGALTSPLTTEYPISATFTGTAQGGTSTPVSLVQPTAVVYYAVKVLTTTLTGSGGVISLGGMMGDLLCGAGLDCTGLTISNLYNGTVTSVGASSSTPALSISGSPITSSGSFTFTCNVFTASDPGCVPAAGGNTGYFLRADQTWAPASGTGLPGGVLGSIQYNNAGNFDGFVASGDATIDTATGTVTVAKTGGVAFAASATTDTTNASNIASGTLNTAQLPSPFTNGTRSGNTSVFATTSGTLTNGDCVQLDASGNLTAAGAACNTGGGSLYVADRTALKALDTTTVKVAYLGEAGRYGLFQWIAGNYSTHISTDTNEGVYIKANAIASSAGAWVRSFDFVNYQILWFGAVADYSTDNTAKVNSAIEVSNLVNTNSSNGKQAAAFINIDGGVKFASQNVQWLPAANWVFVYIRYFINSDTTQGVASTAATNELHLLSVNSGYPGDPTGALVSERFDAAPLHPANGVNIQKNIDNSIFVHSGSTQSPQPNDSLNAATASVSYIKDEGLDRFRLTYLHYAGATAVNGIGTYITTRTTALQCSGCNGAGAWGANIPATGAVVRDVTTGARYVVTGSSANQLNTEWVSGTAVPGNFLMNERAIVKASISGTTMTVTSFLQGSGNLAVGQQCVGMYANAGVTAGTTITVSAGGGTGAYTVNNSQTIAATELVCGFVAANGIFGGGVVNTDTTYRPINYGFQGNFIIVPMAFASVTPCTATIKGALVSVTDSSVNTWGTTITGGGANPVLAYCNGTNWTVAGK